MIELMATATKEDMRRNALPADTGLATWLNVNVQYWRIAALLLAILMSIPLIVVFSAWATPSSDVWHHLASTVLPTILRNTLILIIGVGLGVLVLGAGLAWLTTMCEFPGRRFMDWALMLPLSMPAYVLAFVLVGLFDYSGAVPVYLRESIGIDTSVFPAIRGTWGIILVMVLAFYPYVYMLARAAFISQGRNLINSGRVLGLGPWAAFYRVAIPMARPALAAGTALAVMEVLADFGAVSVFNYDTFTTAIYKTWMGLFNLGAAAQLASLLLVFVFFALIVERSLRQRKRFDVTRGQVEDRIRLRGWHKAGAMLFTGTVFAIAFFIPVLQLLWWAGEVLQEDLNARYLGFVWNTVSLGFMSAVLVVFGALMLAYTYRLKPDPLTRVTVRIATLGYALPGSVLAVGIMLAVVWIDNTLAGWLNAWFGMGAKQLITGTVMVLIVAYIVRFMAVAYGPVDSAFERIRPSTIQAARSLGAGNWQILWKVSIPMLSGGLMSAALLVFVEVMKEMPATLLLRPFGWDTLATRIFEMTSEGEWERAALPAIALVLTGLIPVIMLVRRSQSS